MPIEYETLRQKVLDAATECGARGRVHSQQKTVLDKVASDFGGNMHTMLDLDLQQAILTCWHDLFREGALSWGLDLDNPGPPFFHIPQRPGPQNRPRQ